MTEPKTPAERYEATLPPRGAARELWRSLTESERALHLALCEHLLPRSAPELSPRPSLAPGEMVGLCRGMPGVRIDAGRREARQRSDRESLACGMALLVPGGVALAECPE